MPIGFHFAWNVSEGLIFGFPLSGVTGFSLLKTTNQGPDLFMGGSFGPEGGCWELPPAYWASVSFGLACAASHWWPLGQPQCRKEALDNHSLGMEGTVVISKPHSSLGRIQ